eukprot:TRINITY_DN16222_c0_g1_i2.p1 TRINITY_DN16222_c0_g1~~TRINITY_DN16222_c0_g1_i2.p1  ORF type:complete len:407 (-),score=70.44 TRINITY_DN16222_c0_g1_i2:151-1371(-)
MQTIAPSQMAFGCASSKQEPTIATFGRLVSTASTVASEGDRNEVGTEKSVQAKAPVPDSSSNSSAGTVFANLASGAHPSVTFPNTHLLPNLAGAKWCSARVGKCVSATSPAPASDTKPRAAKRISATAPATMFPNCHLLLPQGFRHSQAPCTTPGQKQSSLASGAHPTVTFPNTHLLSGPGNAKWSASQVDSALHQLREAIHAEDWEKDFAQGLTTQQMCAQWSASPERCAALQKLAAQNESRRILEVGSFCGVSSLALADVLPQDGEVLSLELEPRAVEIARQFQARSRSGSRIKTVVGNAMDSLQELAESGEKAFDMVVIDADKENMQAYFNFIWECPGLLSAGSLVCVDMTNTACQDGLDFEGNSPHVAVQEFRQIVGSCKAKTQFSLVGMLVVRRGTGVICP